MDIINNNSLSIKLRIIKKHYQLYLLLLPAIAFFIIFKYIPLYGMQIAFRDFIAVKGFFGSPWVGLKHFERFFTSPDFMLLIKNTFGLSLYNLVVGFPLPIIIALLLNQMGSKSYKKFIQNVIYAPYFISVVVLVGMIMVFLSPRYGLVNHLIKLVGFEPIFFMGEPAYFKSIYVLSGVWQTTGYSTVIYLAALAGINPELYESAIVDGANKWQKMWYIDLPGILPTAIILLILNSGNLMTIGFEKVYLMQNELNRLASEVISTYEYKQGIQFVQFSYSVAIGLFNAVVNLFILLTVNKMAKRVSETSLL